MLFSKAKCSLLKQLFPFFTNKVLADKFHTSEEFMEQFGHKYLLRKDKAHLSKVRSLARKGKTKILKAMTNIEQVKCKMEWFRTFLLGEARTGQLSSAKECHSLSVELSRWNLSEGRAKGIRLRSSRNLLTAQVTLFAVPYKEKN